MDIEERRVNFWGQVIYGNSFSAVVRILLGFLMLFSGWFKVLDPESFRTVVLKYDMIPVDWTAWVALVLPVLECLVGLFMVVGIWVRGASLLAAGMMLVFTVAISVNLARGNTFDCGCFELNRLGIGIDETISGWLIARDIFLTGAFMMVFLVKRHLFSIDALLERIHLENIE